MRTLDVFADSFLDGFSVAGFLETLSRPGSATRLFSPACTPTQGDFPSVAISEEIRIDAGRREDWAAPCGDFHKSQ
jgi:hypothetical protein